MSNGTSTRHPRRRAEVEQHRAGDQTDLVLPGGRSIALNDVALALWELCDGRTTTAEMIRAMDLFFDADVDVIRTDVKALLDELTEQGYLEWVP